MMTPSKFSKKKLFSVVILLGIAACIGLLYSTYHKVKRPLTQNVTVTTTKAIQKDVSVTTNAIGTVQPYITVAVKSRIDGHLTSVHFKEGDHVKAGQILFKIDSHPYNVALEQAKANLVRDQAQLDNLRKKLDRYTPLVKKGYISKQDYDQAEANMKAQAATILAAKAAIDQATLNLNYSTIHAPISGRTGKSLVHQGNLVRANDTEALVVINQIKPIYVVFSLPEQQLSDIKKSIAKGVVPVSLQIKGQTDLFKAELSFLDNAVDMTTGMIQLKAVFPNEKEEIWPGQYIDVTLPLSEIKKAVVIPTRAIQIGPEGSYLYIVNDDSHVTSQPVELGPILGDLTVVHSLQPDTVVVTTGQSQLIEGSLVHIVN